MKTEFRLLTALFMLTTVVVRSLEAVDRVPVLMWSNDQSLSCAPALGGHVITQESFRKLYVDPFVEDGDIKTILVFLQDELSLMEINQNADVYSISSDGGSFKQTKNIMTEMKSAFLASVISPVSVFSDVRHNFPGKVYALHEPFQLHDLDLKAGEKQLVVIDLPKQHGDGQTSYLHRIDDIINNVTVQAKALLGKFVVLYTGSRHRVHNALQQHSGRHLLSTDVYSSETNSTAFLASVPGEFLMHSLNISISYNGNKNSTYLSTNISNWSVTAEDDCSAANNVTSKNSTCTITLGYLKDIPLGDSAMTNFTMNMQFRTTATGFWYLEKFKVDYINETEGSMSVKMNSDFIAETPLEFSYHCHQQPPIGPKKNETDPGFKLNFHGFQIQAFKVKNGAFGYYNDCVYFFTIPIFMGLICTAILLAILLFGFKMMSDIKTMDRLDDPKGKTISVTVSE